MLGTKQRIFILVGLIFLASILGVLLFNRQLKQQTERVIKPTKVVAPTKATDGVACTMEARLCPDGSYVGRQPPNCEFAPCPGEKGYFSPKPTKPAPTLKKAFPKNVSGCVDYRGKPVSEGCESIQPEGRACSQNTDCQATCGQGCVNRKYLLSEKVIDCTAVPEYACACVDSSCVVVK